MQKLSIAYGSSRLAKFWANKSIEWDELCDRLRTTVRTGESTSEYEKMNKADKELAKDKGGFVAGHLKGNRRKAENVVCRSMISLDADKLEVGFLERFEKECPYEACYYTTHSHTPSVPRARILLPLTRDISADEYVAIARFLADGWGMDQFDECSYLPYQLMYWPSTSFNGEYLFKQIKGPWLNPDEYLSKHPNWNDLSLLPTSSRQSGVIKRMQKEQEDPLTKKGVVGAFCRTYSVEDVMEKFLSDVYSPSVIEGRYDYIAGKGHAGVIVYDGKFSFSHHATDCACGKLLNAFDLVRIHRFGDIDEKASFKAMCDFAISDDEVKVSLINERLGEAEEDFSDTDDSWKKKLTFQSKSGKLEDTVENLTLILTNDSRFKNFAYNELRKMVQVTGPLPWSRPDNNLFWREADRAHLMYHIDSKYMPFSIRNFDNAFTKVVEDRSFHPIKDYLNSLPKWDGIKRVEDIFIKYMQADDTQYVRSVTRKTFAAAVARIYEPGIKFDSLLVLDGAQGIGKSSIFRELVSSNYYSDTLSLYDMNDKSGAEKLQGFWVVEIEELAGMKKADIERVKAFLSTLDDMYRPSYGRVVENHPRQCIIIATVNGERGYLRDITGNRRFWVIKLHQTEQKKKWSIDEDFRSQFWAEAKMIWESGEKLYLENDVLEEAKKAQQAAMEIDERASKVEEYLNKPLPRSWDKMSLLDRKNYLNGTEFGSPEHSEFYTRTEVCNAEIWCECFGRDYADLKPSDSYALAAIMCQIDGWERTSHSKRLPLYGRQRMYRIH